MFIVGVRVSPERDISSLRALGPGGGQISRVVHISARAAFGVFAEKCGLCRRGTHLSNKCGFVHEGHTFIEKVVSRKRGTHLLKKGGFVQEGHTFYRKSVVSCKRDTLFPKTCGFVQEGHTFIEKVWLPISRAPSGEGLNT